MNTFNSLAKLAIKVMRKGDFYGTVKSPVNIYLWSCFSYACKSQNISNEIESDYHTWSSAIIGKTESIFLLFF